MQIFKNPNYNFVRWRWPAIALSLVVIIAGAVVIGTQGLKLGVEFEGGTIVLVRFAEPQPALERVRSSLQALPGNVGSDAVVQQYGDSSQRQVMIRVAHVGAESGGSLSETADAVEAALRAANLGAFDVVGREIVGPVVGDQLKRQGTWATVLALGGSAKTCGACGATTSSRS
jgi:preprotein translocase subunit SecF